MQAKRTWGSIVAAMALAMSSLITGMALPPDASAAAPPNIVVIMTDDQWFESMAYLPKTTSLLGANGVTFTNYHASNPICCPSRSTYLTGQYSHNHGVESNSEPNGGFAHFDDSSTLATWLHAAGYHTTLLGKYLNGYGYGAYTTYIPPGWDNWRAAVLDEQLLYDYTLNENGTLVNYGSAPADFKTDVLARLAVENVHARASQGPFFMSVNVTAPHDEFDGDSQTARAAPRHEQLFAGEPFPVKGNFDEANVSDKPAWVRRLPRLTTALQGTIAQSWRDKLEGLQSVDDLVESLVNALSLEGVLDRTVIIFISDNGYFFGEHRIPDGKLRVYEEATRVPLIIRGGGFAGGAIRSQVVGNIDLAPTIAAFAGAVPTLKIDGISLIPYATRASYQQNRAILLENSPLLPNSFNAIRTKKWVYSRLASGDEELYNVRTDPLQLASKHAAAGQAANKAALAALLDQLETCAGATCNVSYSN